MEAITRLAFDTILASRKQSRTDTEMAVMWDALRPLNHHHCIRP